MKSRSLLICLLLAMPAAAPGASKEILELQRDIAQLQQQIKDLQRSQDEKFAAVTVACMLPRTCMPAAGAVVESVPLAAEPPTMVRVPSRLIENVAEGVTLSV